ncbi:hypothetical protein Hypma_001165 [Hypsizygus marmoreus]|uniref:Uncharacterized protein n=1 Tax=Hypsizygus marmoreus TaxID=39966 RepID=A0A369JCV6_HYPMA|nr:hypothetical protein Hypma_001165 [Hypsizygus marmoreus]
MVAHCPPKCIRDFEVGASLIRHPKQCLIYKDSQIGAGTARKDCFSNQIKRRKALRKKMRGGYRLCVTGRHYGQTFLVLYMFMTTPFQSGTYVSLCHALSHYRIPDRFQDIVSEPPAPATEALPEPVPILRRVYLHVRDFIRTHINSLGILRKYHRRPSFDPNQHVQMENQ